MKQSSKLDSTMRAANNVAIGTPAYAQVREQNLAHHYNAFEVSNNSHWQHWRSMQIMWRHRQRVARACNPV